MKIFKYLILSLLFFGCRQGVNDKRNHNDPATDKASEQICLLISRGGREIPLEVFNNDSTIPDVFQDGIYSFELDGDGKLKVAFGYGEITTDSDHRSDLSLNQVVSVDSVNILAKQLKAIFELSDTILKDKEYRTNQFPTDSWLIKLKTDNKKWTYYTGDAGVLNSPLSANYLFIIDKIVDLQLELVTIDKSSPNCSE